MDGSAYEAVEKVLSGAVSKVLSEIKKKKEKTKLGKRDRPREREEAGDSSDDFITHSTALKPKAK